VCSYEANHFGKRVRSGSISGRLRSASDLEDRGIIDRHQRGILKDLIIVSGNSHSSGRYNSSDHGDTDLQMALDEYEDGDITRLEGLIKNGSLPAVGGGAGGAPGGASNIDILEELDLDFLTVNDIEDIVSEEQVGGNTTTSGAGAKKSKPMTIPQQRGVLTYEHNSTLHHHQQHGGILKSGGDTSDFGSITPPLSMPQHQQTQPQQPQQTTFDDGIGDLEFNADFSSTNLPNNNTLNNTLLPTGPKSGSRNRLNSLADTLLMHADSQKTSFVGGWVDVPPGMTQQQHTHGEAPLAPHLQPNLTFSSGLTMANHVTAPNGILKPTPLFQGNTLRNGKANSAPRKKTAAFIQREAIAEQKRRDRELKRRERDVEKQKKKELTAQVRLEKKKKKAAAAALAESVARQKEQFYSSKKHNGHTARDSSSGTNNANQHSHQHRKEIPSGLGLPRTMSDPNISSTIDEYGLLSIDSPAGWVGAYSPQSRRIRINRFLAKRRDRVWTKKVKYDVRKNFADSRLRVKGRFVKKEDEGLMRDLMSLT